MSPAPPAPEKSSLAIPTEWFRWVDTYNAVAMSDLAYSVRTGSAVGAAVPFFRFSEVDQDYGRRLGSMLQVRGQGAVRIGWLFLAGSERDEAGRRRRIFQPLVQAQIRVSNNVPMTTGTVHVTSDNAITPMITDLKERHRLEAIPVEVGGGGITGVSVSPNLLAKMPKLRAYAGELATAAGFPHARVVPASATPEEFMARDEVVVVAGLALYAVESDVYELSKASSLLRWQEADLEKQTAMHALYAVGGVQSARVSDAPVLSPLSLTPSQSNAVRSARSEPLTVVSGAPGTGKSHTLAAIALDAVNRNENVLIVAKTSATVDALTELLEQCPGPTPVVFGSDERRKALADRLASGRAVQQLSDAAVATARERAAAAHTKRQELRALITRQLEAEERLRDGGVVHSDDIDLGAARARALQLGSALELAQAGGWLARRRAWKDLRSLLSAPNATDDELRALAHEELVRFDARDLLAKGGQSLAEQWNALAEIEARTRTALGEAMHAESRSPERIDGAALAAVNALAVALRSGRGVRRDQLRRLRQADITRALPLWIGTLGDVDDLLPPQAGYFDLVILDEAASIDQPLAAPALLRGKRGVVAGDPRQMRQVSFLSDKEHDDAMRMTELDTDPVLSTRLDVRRNSALDLAMGSAPAIILDEHFRSNPHLIEFVLHRLYNDDVHVASRRPTTQDRDCIEVVRVPGTRDRKGVVFSEVHEVVSLLRKHKTGRSVGIVTPFRAQADAIEEAVLTGIRDADIASMDLRIGTVHGFQGNERDLVIVSLGVGEADPAAWHFVEDLSLLAVMLTRARTKMIVVVSGEPPERGLLAEFLAQADTPPGVPKPAGPPPSTWVTHLVDGLTAAGIDVLPRYPSGRHVADLVVDDSTRDVAIEAEIHPTGVESHIRRRLEMMGRGWRFEEAFRSQWLGREAELVVDLAQRLKAPRS